MREGARENPKYRNGAAGCPKPQEAELGDWDACIKGLTEGTGALGVFLMAC